MKTKELNPEIFGEIKKNKLKMTESLLEPLNLGLSLGSIDFDQQLQETQKDLETLQNEVRHWKDDTHENIQNTKLRMDRLQTSVSRLEQNHNGFVQEMSEKMHLLLQKFGEQKKYDQKVQDMIDRHSNLLKGYEIRMNQAYKILAQKEAELVQAHTMINETKMELARLKRL